MKKKMHAEFVGELSRINPNIEVIGKYSGNKTKIKCRCLICNDSWEPTPNALLRGTGCPKCSGNKKKTHEEFVSQLKNINPDITIIGKYVGALVKIECKCSLCGGVWETRPSVLLSGYGCPYCAKKNKIGSKKRKSKAYKPRKTQEEFVNQIKEVNPYIEILEKYNGLEKKIKCRCLMCDNEWSVAPKNLFGGKGCPNCASSKGEKRIETYLKERDIFYVSQKKFDGLIGVGGRQLSYDFFIPQYNILVEFNGKQHENPVGIFGGNERFATQQEHDKRKRKYAKEHSFDLLEIWYYDLNNIEQILNKKLHVNNEKSA